MKRHAIFVLFTFILLTFLVKPRLADDPEQEFCTKRKAVRRSSDFLIDPVIKWSVIKITRMPKPYPEDLPTDKNVCSAFTFIEGCGMMRYTLTGWTSSYQDVQTIAYRSFDKNTANIMVLDRRMTFKDDHYEVLYAVINKMRYVKSNEESEEEKKIPKSMSEINENPIMYAMVEKGLKDEWRIFQMCDQEVTWVVVPTDKAESDLGKYMEPYAEEINEKLNALNVDMSAMVTIDHIKFPFEPIGQSQPFSFAALKESGDLFKLPKQPVQT